VDDAREFLAPEVHAQEVECVRHQLCLLTQLHSICAAVQHLDRRVARDQGGFLTFPRRPRVEPENRPAEREISEAVLVSKVSVGCRSGLGARAPAVITSVERSRDRDGAASRFVYVRETARSARVWPTSESVILA
jgi:hypothetical protein